MTEWKAEGEVFSFLRRGGAEIFCAFNLGEGAAEVALPPGQWERIGESVGSVAPAGGKVRLSGWGCCIARRA